MIQGVGLRAVGKTHDVKFKPPALWQFCARSTSSDTGELDDVMCTSVKLLIFEG